MCEKSPSLRVKPQYLHFRTEATQTQPIQQMICYPLALLSCYLECKHNSSPVATLRHEVEALPVLKVVAEKDKDQVPNSTVKLDRSCIFYAQGLQTLLHEKESSTLFMAHSDFSLS